MHVLRAMATRRNVVLAASNAYDWVYLRRNLGISAVPWPGLSTQLSRIAYTGASASGSLAARSIMRYPIRGAPPSPCHTPFALPNGGAVHVSSIALGPTWSHATSMGAPGPEMAILTRVE